MLISGLLPRNSAPAAERGDPAPGHTTSGRVLTDLAGRGYEVGVPDLSGTVVAGPPYCSRQAEMIARSASGQAMIVAEFFEIGESRTLAWGRRPQAAAQLAAPGRGRDAIAIEEYERAFHAREAAVQHRPYFRRLVTSGPGPREPEHAFGVIAIPVLSMVLFTYLSGALPRD